MFLATEALNLTPETLNKASTDRNSRLLHPHCLFDKEARVWKEGWRARRETFPEFHKSERESLLLDICPNP